MMLAKESPMAAQRPWPMCMGPTGLAETYSSWTFWPLPTFERPKSKPSSITVWKTSFELATLR